MERPVERQAGTRRWCVVILAVRLSAVQIVHRGPQFGFLSADSVDPSALLQPEHDLDDHQQRQPRKLISPPHPIDESANRQHGSSKPGWDRLARTQLARLAVPSIGVSPLPRTRGHRVVPSV